MAITNNLQQYYFSPPFKYIYQYEIKYKNYTVQSCITNDEVIGINIDAIDVLLVNSVKVKLNINKSRRDNSFWGGMIVAKNSPTSADKLDFYR